MKVESAVNLWCRSEPCGVRLLAILTGNEIGSRYIQECKILMISVRK